MKRRTGDHQKIESKQGVEDYQERKKRKDRLGDHQEKIVSKK